MSFVKRLSIITIVSFSMLIGYGAWMIRSTRGELRRAAETELAFIAQHKIGTVERWRAEHKQDAITIATLTGRFVFPGISAEWDENEVARRLDSFWAGNSFGPRYSNILFVHPSGRVLCSSSGEHGDLPDLVETRLRDVFDSGQVVISDPHTDSHSHQLHQSIVVPVHAAGDPRTGPALGALVLIEDVEEGLFELVESWPLPSRSIEIVLGSLRGDSLAFLNPDQIGRGANPTIALSDNNHLPIVRAALGELGVVEDIDYRGIPVLAYVGKIPGSNWLLVCKEDRSDALTVANRESIMILFMFLGTGALMLVLVVMAGMRNHRKRERAQLEAVLLQRSRERIHETTFHRAAVGIAHVGPDGRWLKVNGKLCEMLGYSEDELLGLKYHEITHPEDLGADRKLVDELIQDQRSTCSLDKRFLHRDGSYVWSRLSVSLSRDEQGQPDFYIAFFEDLQQRKQAELALQDSEARLAELVQSAPIGIFASTESGAPVHINPAMVSFLGLDNPQAALESIQDIGQQIYKNPEDREQFIQLLAEEGVVSNFEFEGRHKDGSSVWLELDAVLTLGSDNRRIIEGFARNITSRKQAEFDRNRLMQATEQLTETIVITDSEGLIQYVNPAFSRTTGYSRDEALGQNPRFLKSGQMGAASYTDMWTTIASGEVWSGCLINKKKDGSIFREECTISPVKDELGKVCNYIAVKRDISREEELQDQLRQSQKMDAVGQLAGGVAHDFNNILQAIMGYSQMITDCSEADSEAAELSEEITQASLRAAALTRQLLAFSRKQVIAPAVLDVNEGVANLLKMLGRLIGEEINLVWKPGHKLWPVWMDPEQFNQVLMNLVVNARDAIDGQGTVELATAECVHDEAFCESNIGAQPGDYITLQVSDTGCGMSPELVSRIFEPFFTTKGQGKGTGLGLSTVYGIVKQNEGYVEVRSELNAGSRFIIHLPRCSEEKIRTIEEETGGQIPRGSESVLLVEDEEPLLKLGTKLIRSLGYTVHPLQDPKEALTLVNKSDLHFDLLVSDVVMPNMNGRELYDLLKSRWSALSCLFVSGYSKENIIKRGVLDERTQFLSKPFTREDLARKLRAALSMN